VENPTRDKVQEAIYFLSMMKRSFEDDNVFRFNLSAFLSAARTITDYMKKQYGHCNGFAEWYCAQAIKMSADQELKYLNKARAENIHKEYVPTGATRTASLGIDVILVKEGSSHFQQREEPERRASTESSRRTVRRFFSEFKQMGVIEFCENQLCKLSKITRDCEDRFR